MKAHPLPALMLTLALGSIAIAVPAPTALAAPRSAPCAVCVVREGAGPEPVRATAVYQGKRYDFCQESCRQEFLKNPGEFLKSESPRPAPAFALKSLDGKPVTLDDYKGKVVLLDFWATWCSPCVAAMPKLQKLHAKYAEKGFAVVGIAIDEKGAAVVAPVVAKKKVKYPVLIGDEAAWTAYSVKSLPALFLVDRQGRIVRQFGGGTSHGTLEKEVARLVGE